jgi:hypothetical protein
VCAAEEWLHVSAQSCALQNEHQTWSIIIIVIIIIISVRASHIACGSHLTEREKEEMEKQRRENDIVEAVVKIAKDQAKIYATSEEGKR